MIIKPRPHVTYKYWVLINILVSEYLVGRWFLYIDTIERGDIQRTCWRREDGKWKSYGASIDYAYINLMSYREATPEEIEYLEIKP